jgi:hypothetical protein
MEVQLKFMMKKPPMRAGSTWMLILIFMSATASAGELNFRTPVVSGSVTLLEGGGETHPRELSRGQLQALTLWLGLHRSAWHGISTPASNGKRLLQLGLKGAEGKSATIEVVAKAQGGVLLRLTSSEKWSYGSFWGLIKSAAAAQSLSDEEWAVLKRVLGQ